MEEGSEAVGFGEVPLEQQHPSQQTESLPNVAHISGEDLAGAGASEAPPEQKEAGAQGAELFQPTLFSYIANDLVWARAGTKGNEPFWPVRHFSPPPLALTFRFILAQKLFKPNDERC